MATVLRANAESSELGGHIASYQSAATLYEVGFNHFWHAPTEEHGGDLVYMQGHSSPGVYARAFLEGRLSEEDLLGFRQEVSKGGLSSYPHPWLMPDFWQFPTVSMGLGPIMAIYQARFMKYLTGRGLADTTGRKVWAFLGDGETDEPESLGAISLAGHEHLDNLVFVVNCNLQRLDGPVRGNGKIIQELETVFRGAGWNVLKVIWGNKWDPLLEADHDGLLKRRMDECVDGEYQTFKSRDGAYVREQLLRRLPRAGQARRGLVRRRDLGAQPRRPRPDEGLRRLRGGDALRGPPDGDPRQDGQGLRDGRGRRGPEHHPPAEEDDRRGAVRLPRPLRAGAHRRADRQEGLLQAGRGLAGDDLPARAPRGARRRAAGPPAARAGVAARARAVERSRRSSRAPASARSRRRWRSSGSSSTLVRDKQIGKHVVPIVPDESRTFGMEGMFRQLGIFSQVGQLYRPEDSEQLMFYKEDKKGQILQEGINEAGAFSSWIASGTSYSNHGDPDDPVLHLLLDVRLPAGRRPRLGGRRQPHARVPARRHRRAHDAQRRGPAARGRPLAPAVLDDPELRLLRPDLRLRGRGDRAGGPAADGRRAGGRLLLPHADERELPAPGRCPRARRRGSCRASTGSRATARAPSSCSARARSCARSRRRRSLLARRLRASRPTSGASRASPSWRATAWGRALVAAAPGRGRARRRTSRACSPTRPPSRRRTTCARSPSRSARTCPATTPCSAPTATAAATGARSLREFFEVDRHYVALAALRSVAPDKAAEAIEKYEIDAEAEAPWRR